MELLCSVGFHSHACTLISSLVNDYHFSPLVVFHELKMGMMQLADVEQMISTLGNHNYTSMTTNKYSPGPM